MLSLFLFLKRGASLFSVGLDAAGKTTILYKLKLGEIVTTIPTIGKLVSSCSSPRLGSDDVIFYRVQRGDGGIQEHQLHSLGRRRPRQDPTALAPLFPKHTRTHLRRR